MPRATRNSSLLVEPTILPEKPIPKKSIQPTSPTQTPYEEPPVGDIVVETPKRVTRSASRSLLQKAPILQALKTQGVAMVRQSREDMETSQQDEHVYTRL